MDRILNLYRLQESDSLFLFWVKELFIAVLIFALFWGIAHIVRYILVTWCPHFTAFTATDLDDRILERVTPLVSVLIVVSGLYFSVRSLPLPEKAHNVSSGLVFVVAIIILTIIAYRAVDETLKWYSGHVAERTGVGLDRQILPLMEKLVSIFLVGTALIITLKHFNYDILSLVTALGIGSLAIGMAAKDTLANMISGFTLMIDRPFRIGDRIVLSGGRTGDVVDIGLRSTRIRTLENSLLIVPNSELCNSSVVNLAFPDTCCKVRVNVGIGYGSDVDAAKILLVEIASDQADVEKNPSPEAFFASFGDSSLDLSLFFWVRDHALTVPVTDRINSEINVRFHQYGIRIPFPTRAVILEKDA